MPTRTKVLVLIFLSFFSSQILALTQEQISAIQDYLTERAGGGKNGNPMRDANQKLEEIEKRLLPLIFQFKRTGPLVESRLQEFDALQAAVDGGQLNFNPYEDKDWLKSKGRETVQVCCIIRNDQRMAQAIQENVARGYPPIAPQTLERITNQIREANRDGGGGLIMEDDEPETTNPREIKAGRFRATSNSKASSPGQKMLDNLGYSDKPAPAPAPPAAVTPPAPTPVPAPDSGASAPPAAAPAPAPASSGASTGDAGTPAPAPAPAPTP